MKRSTNYWIQLIAIGVQVVNANQGLIPPKWAGLVTAVVAGVQAGLGVMAHGFNPDGSKAEVAWNKGGTNANGS